MGEEWCINNGGNLRETTKAVSYSFLSQKWASYVLGRHWAVTRYNLAALLTITCITHDFGQLVKLEPESHQASLPKSVADW